MTHIYKLYYIYEYIKLNYNIEEMNNIYKKKEKIYKEKIYISQRRDI